jgi:hypothetical protein
MLIEIVLNYETQIFFFANQFISLRGKYMFMYIIGKKLSLNFNLGIWTKSLQDIKLQK